MRGAWGETYVLAWQSVTAANDAERRQYAEANSALLKRLDGLEAKYADSIRRADDRERFEKYRELRRHYDQVSASLFAATGPEVAAAEAKLRGPIHAAWTEGRTAVQTLLEDNNKVAEEGASSINQAVQTAKISIEVSLIAALLESLVAGYLLFRSITVPMRAIVRQLADMRGGDFRQRLSLNRKDEFLEVEQGFNQMTGDLTALVGQAQRSAIQVTTSVNEIAATARQQLHRHRIEHLVAHHHAFDVLGQCIHPAQLGGVGHQLGLLAGAQAARQIDDGVALHLVAQRIQQLQRQRAGACTELPHFRGSGALQRLAHLHGQRLAEQGREFGGGHKVAARLGHGTEFGGVVGVIAQAGRIQRQGHEAVKTQPSALGGNGLGDVLVQGGR